MCVLCVRASAECSVLAVLRFLRICVPVPGADCRTVCCISQTRSAAQVRSHAQKHFIKLHKERVMANARASQAQAESHNAGQ